MKTRRLYPVRFLFATFLAALATLPAVAQTVPPLINYQGRLVNSNNIPLTTGDYELRFSIWDAATGGTQVWGPQLFDGQTGPGLGPKVPVVQGWFNVMLGPMDTANRPIVEGFAASSRFLEIQIGAASPITPRQQILSAPYAIRSANSETLAGHGWNALSVSWRRPEWLYHAREDWPGDDRRNPPRCQLGLVVEAICTEHRPSRPGSP